MVENLKSLIWTSLIRMSSLIEPKENIWIFSSVDNKKFNYNSKYLFEYVRKNLPSIEPRYVINDDRERERLAALYGEEYFIESKTKDGIRKVLEGAVWFTSAGLPVYGPGLGKNRRIINLWHGVPLKKIALMENHFSFLSRIYFKWIFSSNYSEVLTTSRKLVPVMAKSFALARDKIKVWGQPRNDLLYEPHSRQEILKRLYGIEEEVRFLVLYAPTFREYGKTRLFPFEDFDPVEWNRFLERERIMVLIRYHLEEEEQDFGEGKWMRTVNEDKVSDIMEILSAFDGVITDYSSIYIDFLLLERPLLFLPYDLEEYEAKRGMNFPYEKVTPGPKPDTMKELMEEMIHLFCDPSYYQKDRQRLNRYFNQIQEPCSAIICEKILKETRNEQ